MPSPAEVIRGYVARPAGLGNLGAGITEISETLTADAAEAFLAGQLVAAPVEVETVTAGIVAVTGWEIVLLCVALIVALRIWEYTMVSMLRAIPLGVGSQAAKVITTIFSPLDNLENWLIARAGDLMGHLVHAVVQMIGAAVRIEFPSVTHTTIISTSPEIRSLQNQIDTLKGEYAHAQYEIKQLQAHTYGTTAPSPAVITLEERVTRLERANTVIAHDLNVLHTDVITLDGYLSRLERLVHNETANLNAVRAVQFGVQDVLNEVNTTMVNLALQVDELQPQTVANTEAVRLALPLNALMYLGTAGIKTLQRLEENPCQCPSLGGLGGLFWDALILDEVMANGL